MNEEKVENVKMKLNYWAWSNEVYLDNLAKCIARTILGIADPEEIGVLACGTLIETFHGWNFELPKTKDVLNYDTSFWEIEAYPWDPDKVKVEFSRKDSPLGDCLKRFLKENLL